jgi:hypothetical protein
MSSKNGLFGTDMMKLTEEKANKKFKKAIEIPLFLQLLSDLTDAFEFFGKLLAFYLVTIKGCQVKWNVINDIPEDDRFYPHELMWKMGKNEERRRNCIKNILSEDNAHNLEYTINRIDDDCNGFE